MATATLTKMAVAKELADRHYQSEPGITAIVILLAKPEEEALPHEPIKLLEVNQDTIASGIMPLGFDPEPAHGFPYSSVIIEVTPEEWEKIQKQELVLPQGWTLGAMLPRPGSAINRSQAM